MTLIKNNLYKLLENKNMSINKLSEETSLSRKEPFGVYIPLTEDERRIGLVSLSNQANNMTRRIELVGNIDLKTWRETISTTVQPTLDGEVVDNG